MEERCYTASGKVNSPCGPCSLINMLNWKGSTELEAKLAEMGRAKPFHFSDFSSFLVWNRKYGLGLRFFVRNKNLTEEMFKSVYKSENIQKNRLYMKFMALLRHKLIVFGNRNIINPLPGNPVDKIDELINEGYVVAYLVCVWSKSNNDWLGHWRVAYGKKNGKYLVKDSAKSKAPGFLVLTRKEMNESISDLNRLKAFPQLVAFKSKLK